MKKNTAYNQTAPGGKSPEIHIHQEKGSNPTSEKIVEQIVGASMRMAGSMSRDQLKEVVGAVFSEILLSQITEEPVITVARLNELLSLVGVILICTNKGGNQ